MTRVSIGSRTSLSTVVVFLLCIVLVACELEETITIKQDGSGTYVARIAIDKQFAEAVPDIKTRAQQRGFRVVEETETTDRRVLVIQRDFANIGEISDDTDIYALRLDQPSKFKRAYSLRIASRTSARSNGFQKRIMRVTFPVSVTSASSGSVKGRTVEWDATNGGTLEVEAAGIVLPLGLSVPVLVLLILLGLGAAGLAHRRARTVLPACPACGTSTLAAARFCATCGVNVQKPFRVPRVAVLSVIAIAVGTYLAVTVDWHEVAAKYRRNQESASAQASAAGIPLPSVAPTGPWVVFERWLASPDGSRWGGDGVELWAIRPDGTNLRRLTTGFRDEDPTWSPDGSFLVFERSGKNDSGIYAIAADGSNLRRLSATRGNYPSWTRDNRLTFAVSKPEGWRIATADLNGQNERILEIGRGFKPVPSPDGRWIAFNGEEDAVMLVWTADGRTSRVGNLRGYPQAWIDDQHLTVQTADNRCVKTDLDALDTERISGVSECNISFAPGAPHRVVFQFENAIWISEDGLRTKRLLAAPQDNAIYRSPAWSPR